MSVQCHEFLFSLDKRVVTGGEIVEDTLQRICQRIYFAKLVLNFNASVSKPFFKTLVHLREP